MELSIVIPLYNEAESLEELFRELTHALGALKKSYELIFFNDGSADDSSQVLQGLAGTAQKNGVCLSTVHFEKNLGKAAALVAGFDRAEGDVIVTLDADLQDDPAEITLLLGGLSKGYDLVSGWRQQRQDPWTRKTASLVFNAVLRVVTKMKIHDSVSGFKAYKKDAAKALNLYGGFYRFIPVIAEAMGFKVGEVRTNHRRRKYGRSKFGIRRYGEGFFDFLNFLFFMSRRKTGCGDRGFSKRGGLVGKI
jgi:glycosyltransferase involved in cell wall biosynthesis